MYSAARAQLGDKSEENSVRTLLPSGVFVNVRLTFAGVGTDVTRLSLLEVTFENDQQQTAARFQLKSVPVN